MSEAVLTINSRNYGAWSLEGGCLRHAGLDFSVEFLDSSDEERGSSSSSCRPRCSSRACATAT